MSVARVGEKRTATCKQRWWPTPGRQRPTTWPQLPGLKQHSVTPTWQPLARWKQRRTPSSTAAFLPRSVGCPVSLAWGGCFADEPFFVQVIAERWRRKRPLRPSRCRQRTGTRSCGAARSASCLPGWKQTSSETPFFVCVLRSLHSPQLSPGYACRI